VNGLNRFAQTALWLTSGSLFCLGAFASSSGITKAHKPPAKKQAPLVDTIEFNRDIRPILSNKCLACHGQDPKAVRAGLRLNASDSAYGKLDDGKHAIVPGHPEQSEMIARITSKDPDVMMPPPGSNKVLTDEDRATLRQWIKEGAVYKEHWAFLEPTRYTPPAVKDKRWVRNPIDNFVLAELERRGMHPAPEADKATLIRRVSFDITGLPPTIQETQAFLADKSPKAYEKVVDRLLASPRYAERMTVDWLDYARYADSNGYQSDWERFQWSWRDWVLNAFNTNLPYNEFIIKQVAGDMLPNHSLDDVIATGFNRNHRINTEGGVIPEEWRAENVIDRVSTTLTVFCGLTAGCARCHDHKYDPISQKDFYGLCAYFNNVPETGSGEERPVDHPPFIKAPPMDIRAQYFGYQNKMALIEGQLTGHEVAHIDQAAAWKPSDIPMPAGVDASITARYAFTSTPKVVAGSVAAPVVEGEPKFSAGRASGAVRTDDKSYLDLGAQAGNFDENKPFSYAAWVRPSAAQGSAISRMDTAHMYRGWDLFVGDGAPAVHIISAWPDDALKVQSTMRLPMNQWTHVIVTYDGSKKAAGVRIYVNGKQSNTETVVDKLMGSIHTDVTTKVGRRTGSDVYKGLVDDVEFFNKSLSPDEASAIARSGMINGLLAIAPTDRTNNQRMELSRYWCEQNDPKFKGLEDQLSTEEADYAKLDATVPDVMIMQEMPKPRIQHVFLRGQYDHPGDVVQPHIPAVFNPLPAGAPNNRLGLAEWIASPQNPMTSRVEVNRIWDKCFGTGIVATDDDFGTRAEFPSHPKLLDWLATEFVRKGWDMKAMLKEIVMSATYRQSSAVSEEQHKTDPDNRLLARGPRFRLPAEMIRDQAIYVSGMLTEKLGGPSVRPYMPDVWDDVSVYGNLHNYKHDIGPNLHRRSLYTFWKRTGAPPEMTLFDVPGREICTVKRARTDTPLQALVLLDDESFIESSRALAQRAIREAKPNLSDRITFMFQSVTSRKPTKAELDLMVKGFGVREKHYQSDTKDSDKLLAIGDWPVLTTVQPATLAAYTTVASTIFNLDEAITKD
jgi:hypothetical protein